MTTKLFERLVTKFSIKVNDLAKYLEISKAGRKRKKNLNLYWTNRIMIFSQSMLRASQTF